ncbi:MAG: hypothetical protein LBU14_05205 [Candidatus Peribacteria bacterium]|nr:hypothetical protein [Candidatus Peribacteria bacterium]
MNELYKFTNIYELIGLTPEIKSVLKQAKINYWNNISMFSDEEKHEILQSSNIRLINLLNSFTIEAEKINLWKEFFQLFLEEPIYLTKNIENFVDNIKLINENNKHLIYEFIDKM